MDLVLGLSMTARAVRWVLVEGTTGEGRPVDRGAISLDDVAGYDPDGLLRGLVDDNELSGAHHLHAIGVTWTNDAAPLAGHVMEALDARGYGNVFAVSEIESAGMLAGGIAEITGHDDIAVCVVEPDAAVVAIVTPDDVSADRVERSETFVEEVAGLLALTDRSPAALFVLGSDARESTVAELAGAVTPAVITSAESDLAFARGAGLAAALAVNTAAAPDEPRRWTKVGALSSVVGAALVTLVIASSAAVGVHLHPGAVQQSTHAAALEESVRDARPMPKPAEKAVEETVGKVERQITKRVPAAPVAVPAAPAGPPEAVPAAPPPRAPAPEPAYVPPAPEPAYVPPAPDPAYVPPAPEPAYVPPAPEPAYVPPPAPPAVAPPPYVPPVIYPKPRLRDRIIDRIPILNRFR